ncbi:hypothetical protein AA310_05800 [Arthrobacter sp. YC-RL1]|uniref:hypothetical protein n=1 Tax=Arthrobacter sp. YC-RL1 TaxID=1652545 RepID=UPI00063DC255|nr:hypothetical protein [Arthrobacter sp. YC-RL1]ALQ31223.1 hypothetical protein ATC04_12085 [Arthrobacter sp. YC-RL1]KLI87520.1 hypothetical protein AA310_05800 [Arthrobacter sp. YC-RL1]
MDLHTLIETHKDGRSYQALADSSNGAISQKAFQAIATREIKAFPNAETIKGIARALNVQERRVISALAESLGLCQDDPTGPRSPQAVADLEEQHSKLLEKLHHLKEQIYFWQNHAATYRKYRQHFTRLQPIAQQRPWLIAGTQHQADHMNANESR